MAATHFLETIHVTPNSHSHLQQIANEVTLSKNIIVITGAGISTSTGIPDFRSKGGLYSNRSSNTQDPFHITALSHPTDGHTLLATCSELRQKANNSVPSKTHYFIKGLCNDGKLARNYTQNIDDLEQKAGICTDLSRGPGTRHWSSKGRKRQWSSSDELEMHVENLNRGVECVQLHGSLDRLRCSFCGKHSSWDVVEEPAFDTEAKLAQCPACIEHSRARFAAGLRRREPGLLRPDILLYGENDLRTDNISEVLTHDLHQNMDLLLIFGTSLSVKGIRELTKSFAKIVHQSGGIVVFINHTKPAQSIWGKVIDFWVEWDCDSWVEDVEKRIFVIGTARCGIQEVEISSGVAATKAKKRYLGLMKPGYEMLGTECNPIDLTNDELLSSF